MDYAETVSYLDELAGSGIKLGLDPMRRLLDALGSPQDAVPAIHIAGSNGKGSTAAFLSSILTEAGYHVGLYTSPHLVHVEERIAVDRQPISRDAFAAAATHVRHRVDRLLAARTLDRPPTYFELVTAMAFHVFQKEGCDFQVVEVGMGGRLDATNVFERPLACIVTRIDLEHSEHLGPTLEAIAAEKAGIARRGTPVLTFERRPESLAAIQDVVRRAGGTVIDVAKETQSSTDGLGNVTLRVGRATFHELPVPLPGDHQVENLALALRTVEILGGRGFSVNQDQVQMGVGETRWPGRLEVVRTNPTVLLDGAHNPAGARALAAYLESLGRDGRLYLVFGAMKDKDIRGMMEPILTRATKVFVTRAAIDRAAEPEALAEQARKFHGDVTPVATPGEALRAALGLATPQDTVLVTGSLLLVGDVKRLLEEAEA
jgi:dihydrofolate synthase / folylpolyglutamate synthase